MPFNGSGTYTVVYNFTTEAASPPIEIAKLDSQFTDLATALSNCILRDGTGLPTATIDWNTQRITNLGNSTTTTGPTTISQFQSNAPSTLGSVAGTNTITGSLTPALTAYTAGMVVVFTPANSITGATTLNINGLGALDVQKGNAQALVSGDMLAGIPAYLVLDSGADDWILLNPQTPSVTGLSVSGNVTINGTLTTDNTTADEVGFKGLPQNVQSTNYTFVLSDAGKHIRCDVGLTTLTIPANATVAFPPGTAITIFNNSGASISIPILGGDFLRLAATSSTGTRTLADNGLATLLKIGSSTWAISGAGVS